MKERKLVTEYYKKDGEIYCKDVWKEVEKEPLWCDNWRATHKTNPTEKAPSFKSHW